MKWTREVHALPRDHGWKAAPGHKILVIDRGAALLEYPNDWFVEPGSSGIELRDAATAEGSSCVLAVTCMQLPPVDWSDLPLSRLLIGVAEGDQRDRIETSPVKEMIRDGVTVAWTELRVVDPDEHREARSRICLARRNTVHCLITFAFWPEDAARLVPVWDRVVRSLRLGVPVPDLNGGISDAT